MSTDPTANPPAPLPNPAGGETYRLNDPPPAGERFDPVVKVVPRVPLPKPRQRSQRGGLGTLLACNLIVFVASACIMVLELTASRLIAKHVGSSLYTWTSVIGVVLAGITVGNYLGGWIADRSNHARALSRLFLIASVLSYSVLWLDTLAGSLSRPDHIGWPAWIVLMVAGIFLLPAVALGTISPLAASLALDRTARTGITVGNVYAWGALGSIVGTFLAGFYLIDAFGTRSIVSLVAAALALMGVLTAAGRPVFRAAVLCGWLQFVLLFGMAAAANAVSAGVFTGCLATALTVGQDGGVRRQAIARWQEFGSRLGRNLHELGLTLRLRVDAPDEYHDESHYSYINVGDSIENGDAVKYLKLDKLIHSYYNPARPTALYYDYEQIYAAVTELAATGWQRTTTVPCRLEPSQHSLLHNLASWARYDPAARTLQVDGGLSQQRRLELLGRSSAAEYWRAVAELQRSTQSPRWGGYQALPVGDLPDGFSIPEALVSRVRHDRLLRMLTCTAPLTDADALALVQAGPDAAWHRAVEELFARSRRVSALFLGGGGFVFPRWIEAHFPLQPRIDVAEIDPAVHRAVESNLGLPPALHTAVRTYFGDARNFVDDRLRANRSLAAQGRPGVLYDFIYGDAFNDFSVPWHLTTREFTQKVHELLQPDGVYLVNIIEMYPRTVFPGGTVGRAQTEFRGTLPEKLLDGPLPQNQWIPAAPAFAGLEIRRDAAAYSLRFHGTMTDQQYARLYDLAPRDAAFQAVVEELYTQSTSLKTFEGELPAELLPESIRPQVWTSCPEPFESMEVFQSASGRFVLAARGVLADETRRRLQSLRAHDDAFDAAVAELASRTLPDRGGRFLGCFVRTATEVFPCVYVFSSEVGTPHDDRDTFVVVASRRRLDFSRLQDESDHWSGGPFASWESDETTLTPTLTGQMSAVLALARGITLTDDYAPVDNFLAPVVKRQK